MLSGFINVLKPTGMTSSDVVVKVRGILKRKLGGDIKVGHFGTLDPAGAGVLPVAVGRATRLFDYAVAERKVYRAGFVFGTETDTLDSCGAITETNGFVPSLEEILSVLPEFCGKSCQIPPKFSSKSINGERAYDLARAGKTFELRGRDIEIFDISFVEQNGKSFVFDISCSGGTYIRSIVRDIAKRLNTCGYMSYIIRLKSGLFDIGQAAALDFIAADPEKYILPLSYFTDSLPSFTVDGKNADKVMNGVKIKFDCLPEAPFAVYIGGELVGLGINENNCLKVVTRLL